MPLKDSYVIWNNKGGVGKSTLTFHMATQYAKTNPGCKVLVIDLCPQANVSMALLNSREIRGSQHLSSLHAEHKTISFYLQRVTQPLETVRPRDYLTRVNDYNDHIPGNLDLLCGDMHLELVGKHLEHCRSGEPIPMYNPWVDTTSCMLHFIEGYEGKFEGVAKTPGDTDLVVFIDTNPSFSVYTEIAMVAARKLIIPINADDFSQEAVRAMLNLVYGIVQTEEPDDFGDYREYMFSSKAIKNEVERPKIHLLVNNRTTTYNTRTAKAFRGVAEGNIQVLYEAYQQHKEYFTPCNGDVEDLEQFKAKYFMDVKDFHTTAILSLHIGCPLSSLRGNVQVLNEKVKVDHDGLKQYLKCLETLVERL